MLEALDLHIRSFKEHIPNMLKSFSLIKSLLILALYLLIHGAPDQVFAQDVIWEEPVRLRSTEDRVSDPLLLTDPAGRVHLFWTEVAVDGRRVIGQPVIYYMVKVDNNWSTPMDIAIVQGTSPDGLQGQIDSYGYPHILAGGANDPLEYTSARIPSPMSSLDWSSPTVLSTNQLGGNLVIDPEGNLHIILGETDGQVRYLRLDERFRVSQEAIVASLPGTQIQRRPPAMIMGDDGTIHVLIPAITPPFEEIDTYYLRSSDSGENWSELRRITVTGSDAWSLIEDEVGRLHVLYIGRLGFGGRFHRQSTDGGNSWSEATMLVPPERAAGLGGGDLEVDSAGTIHAVFNVGFPEEQLDASMGHMALTDTGWSNVSPLDIGVPGGTERPQIGVTHGNRLHVVWEADRNSIWYVEGRSSASELLPEGLIEIPDSSSEPVDNIPTREIEPSVTVTSNTALSADLLQPPPESNVTVQAIFLSTGTALVVIVLVVFWQRRQRN